MIIPGYPAGGPRPPGSRASSAVVAFVKFNASSALIVTAILLFAAGSLSAQAVGASFPTPNSVSATGRSADQVTPSPANLVHNTTYLVGDDDELQISVWKDPELSKTIAVRSDGKISLPLLGELQAAGKTPVQLQDDITGALRKFITEPVVTVVVLKINSLRFNVLGQVLKPGSYSLTATTTVVDAIATAGGFRVFAKKKSIYVLHVNPDGIESRTSFNYSDYVRGKFPHQNVRLRPGDTVVVP